MTLNVFLQAFFEIGRGLEGVYHVEVWAFVKRIQIMLSASSDDGFECNIIPFAKEGKDLYAYYYYFPFTGSFFFSLIMGPLKPSSFS